MHVDNASKIYVTQIDGEFSKKVRFTYIKLTSNFRKQCAPNLILREFASMQTSQHTHLREKQQHFQSLLDHRYHVPLGETDQHKDQSKGRTVRVRGVDRGAT